MSDIDKAVELARTACECNGYGCGDETAVTLARAVLAMAPVIDLAREVTTSGALLDAIRALDKNPP